MPENQKIGNSDQKQYIINVISNFGSKVILAWIAFWIPSVVIKNLGESQFGLISIAISLLAYFTVVTGALNSALSRFFMLHHVKNEKKQAQEYLSSTVNLLAWFFRTLHTNYPIQLSLYLPTYSGQAGPRRRYEPPFEIDYCRFCNPGILGSHIFRVFRPKAV